MADNGVVFFGNEGQGQLSGRSKTVDDRCFGSAAVWHRSESIRRQVSNRRGI